VHKVRALGLPIAVALLLALASPAPACQGRFLNPITDVCWWCVFPIRIGGISISLGAKNEDYSSMNANPICLCGDPIPRVGLKVSFWEPARVIEPVMSAFCFPSLGGLQLSANSTWHGGSVAEHHGTGVTRGAFQLHYYVYPVFGVLNLLTDLACLQGEGFDLAYMTELDPLWNDDQLAAIIEPEAILFGNPAAQLACMADAAAANAGFPIDPLFWCQGSWEGVYPMTAHLANLSNYAEGSAAATGKLLAKLHRQGLLWGTVGEDALCGKYPMPIWRKSQYKLQLGYPWPQMSCLPIGRSGLIWSAGENIPSMENFVWILWRKRTCCAF